MLDALTFGETNLKTANPKAAMIHLKTRSMAAFSGQRGHDLRIGCQPAYVDITKAHLNRILLEPPTGPEMKRICEERRGQRDTKRTMKSNAHIAVAGVIGFGIEAQRMFAELPVDDQDQALYHAASAVATTANTSLHGLVLHSDETALHAHLTMAGYDLNGVPLSMTMKKQMLSDFQSCLCDVLQEFAPGIERGRRKTVRLKAGATYAETLHASVAELHDRLPAEIAAKQKHLDVLEVKLRENERLLARQSDEIKQAAEVRERLEQKAAKLAERERGRQKAEHELRARIQKFKIDAAVHATRDAQLVAREDRVSRKEAALLMVKKQIVRRIGEMADDLGVGRSLRDILGAIDAMSQQPDPLTRQEDRDGFEPGF